MFLQSYKNLLPILGPILIAVVFCVLGYGTWLLESTSGQYGLAYSLLAVGVGAVIFLPKWCNLTGILTPGLQGVVAYLIIAVVCQLGIYIYIGIDPIKSFDRILLAWGGSLICVALASRIYDAFRNIEERARLFHRSDWFLALGLSALALAVRLLGDTSAAVDEVIHFSEMTYFYLREDMPYWRSTGTGYPFLVHRILYLLSGFLDPIIDKFDLYKSLAALMGAVSIGAWYLVIRVYAPRYIALSASTALLFLGWHWVNSRLVYLYSYDMANLAIGTLCAVIAFEKRRYLPAVLAGFIITYSFLLKKFGVMMIPFFIYIFLDYLITSKRGERKGIILVAVAIMGAAVFAYIPMAMGNFEEMDSPRVALAIAARAQRLAGMNLTPITAFFAILLDAFRQLQIETYDAVRHITRIHKPILDPMLSLLFSVGLLFALLKACQRRECRLQVVGFFLFIMAMVISFPLDSLEPRGLSRRMVGASFFVAWIAASGAEVLASRLVQLRYVAGATFMLCFVSFMINFYYLRAYYMKPDPEVWYQDYGGARANMLQFSRRMARKGLSVVVLNDHVSSIQAGNHDLPDLKIAQSVDEIRSMVRSKGRRWYLIVLPWGTFGNVSPQVVEQLTDLAPLNAWIPGPVDLQDIPMLRYAFVYSP